MLNKEPSKTALLITIGLFVVTLIVTVWLFHYLSNPQARSETFGFTLAFVCFLEFLSFGYFAALSIPSFRKSVVWALYPAIGIIVGSYVVVSVATVIGHSFFSTIVSSPKPYFTAVVIESVVFLIVSGSVIVLNVYKKAEDISMEKERTSLVRTGVIAEEAYQNLLKCREFLDIQTYRNVEQDVRKLKEKFQFCTPFGRSDAVAGIEADIQDQIASLSVLITDISSAPEGKLEATVEKIKHITVTALQAMERREKLLIK